MRAAALFFVVVGYTTMPTKNIFEKSIDFSIDI